MPKRPPREKWELDEQAAIGLRLAQAREKARMSQKDASERLGYTQTWLARIESGSNVISAIDLKRLALVYDHPVEWFLDPDFSKGRVLVPRSRADWDFLFADDPTRAQAHAQMDIVIREAREPRS